MAGQSIAINYVNAAVQYAEQAGYCADGLLSQVGIDKTLLHDPATRITGEQYVSLVLSLMRLTGDELLLAGNRHRSPYGTFAMACHAIIHEPDLRAALLRSFQFYNRLLGDMQLRLHVQGDQVTLMLHLSDDDSTDPLHATTETVLTLLHRVASWLIAQRIPLIEACFTYDTPAHVDEYRALFHCPLKFNQPRNAIIFNARLLSHPLMQDKRSLSMMLRHAPANLFFIASSKHYLTTQIRAMLGRDFSREFPDFRDIAQSLNMAPQTLRRHLREEGTSYQEIKDQLRRDAAIHYLQKPQISLGDIAHLMGFSEPSTFHRAFKKWTGLTPGEYRQGLQAPSNRSSQTGVSSC